MQRNAEVGFFTKPSSLIRPAIEVINAVFYTVSILDSE
jgi:hypothetical protein